MTKTEAERLSVVETLVETIIKTQVDHGERLKVMDLKLDAVLLKQAKNDGVASVFIKGVPLMLSAAAVLITVFIR